MKSAHCHHVCIYIYMAYHLSLLKCHCCSLPTCFPVHFHMTNGKTLTPLYWDIKLQTLYSSLPVLLCYKVKNTSLCFSFRVPYPNWSVNYIWISTEKFTLEIKRSLTKAILYSKGLESDTSLLRMKEYLPLHHTPCW